MPRFIKVTNYKEGPRPGLERYINTDRIVSMYRIHEYTLIVMAGSGEDSIEYRANETIEDILKMITEAESLGHITCS